MDTYSVNMYIGLIREHFIGSFSDFFSWHTYSSVIDLYMYGLDLCFKEHACAVKEVEELQILQQKQKQQLQQTEQELEQLRKVCSQMHSIRGSSCNV